MAKTCNNCGAALPERTDDGVADCQYCGAETRVARKRKRKPKPQPRSPAAPPTPAAATAGSKLPLIALGFVFVAIVVGLVVVKSRSGASGNGPPSTVTLATVAKMGKAHPTFLDTTGVVESPQNQDALQNYDWVLRFARAWAPDAVMTWLEFTVYADGKQTEQAVTYRFISPSRQKAADAVGPLTDEAPWRGFSVVVGPENVVASIEKNAQGTAEATPVSFGCTLVELHRAALSAPRPPDEAPTYRVVIRHQRSGWRARFGNGSFLDPDTCKPL